MPQMLICILKCISLRFEDCWTLPCARKNKKKQFEVLREMPPATKRGASTLAVLRATRVGETREQIAGD